MKNTELNKTHKIDFVFFAKNSDYKVKNKVPLFLKVGLITCVSLCLLAAKVNNDRKNEIRNKLSENYQNVLYNVLAFNSIENLDTKENLSLLGTNIIVNHSIDNEIFFGDKKRNYNQEQYDIKTTGNTLELHVPLFNGSLSKWLDKETESKVRIDYQGTSIWMSFILTDSEIGQIEREVIINKLNYKNFPNYHVSLIPQEKDDKILTVLFWKNERDVIPFPKLPQISILNSVPIGLPPDAVENITKDMKNNKNDNQQEEMNRMLMVSLWKGLNGLTYKNN